MAQDPGVRVVTEGALADAFSDSCVVIVTTGSEARPANAASTSTVLWIGGATEPTNMGVNDVWLASA
jgi:hypothetical protein